MRLLITGDIHGRLSEYQNILESNKYDYSIALGDIGFIGEYDRLESFINPDINKVIFGNHDYYPKLNESYSLGNYSYFFDKVFTIRGAYSVDRPSRLLGRCYFSNEELSSSEMYIVYEEYVKLLPDIVLSHEAPFEIVKKIIKGRTVYKDQTSNFLQTLLDIHCPKIWIFGHHHVDFKYRYLDGSGGVTMFTCLSELSSKIINLEMY